MQMTELAVGQAVEPAFEPFYSEGFQGWYFRDLGKNCIGPYGSEEICRHAMGEIIRMAREKGVRI